MRCSMCFGNASLSNKGKLEAFAKRGPCKRPGLTTPMADDIRRPRLGAPPRIGDAAVDVSHSIAHFRRVLWCTVCGCYATVKIGLLKLSSRGAANRSGQEALRALNSCPPRDFRKTKRGHNYRLNTMNCHQGSYGTPVGEQTSVLSVVLKI